MRPTLGFMDGLRAVFAFDADSRLTIFPTLDTARQAAASGVLAAPHNGIYMASDVPLRLRGRELVPGTEPQLYDLQKRLAEYQRRLPIVPEEVDVAAFAEVWLASKRE